MKKSVKRIIILLLVVVLTVGLAFTAVYGTRLATISTLKEIVPASFYVLDYKADYKLDELLQRNLKDDQTFVNEALDIMYPFLDLKMVAPPLMCTVFKTQNRQGEQLFARNFDLNQVHCLLVRTKPQNGYASIAALFPEIVSVKDYPIKGIVTKMKLLLAPYIITDGFNEKGLGAAVLALGGEPTHQDSGKLPITTNLALRLILDQAATVDEAVELLKKYDMHASGGCNYHFFVTDKSGKSLVIEYYNNEMTLHESAICTNYYLRKDAPHFAQNENSYRRFDIVKDALDAHAVMDEETAMATLAAAKSYVEDKDGLKSTQWSEVFNLDKGTVNICIDGDFEHVYHFTIQDFPD